MGAAAVGPGATPADPPPLLPPPHPGDGAAALEAGATAACMAAIPADPSPRLHSPRPRTVMVLERCARPRSALPPGPPTCHRYCAPDCRRRCGCPCGAPGHGPCSRHAHRPAVDAAPPTPADVPAALESRAATARHFAVPVDAPPLLLAHPRRRRGCAFLARARGRCRCRLDPSPRQTATLYRSPGFPAAAALRRKAQALQARARPRARRA